MELESSGITETLESEVKLFADSLPYWTKYLAEKLMSKNEVTEAELDLAYDYLLQELNLSSVTTKPNIVINYSGKHSGKYKSAIQLTRIENTQGVNALIEKQTIEFGPNATIIYGANGSGKSSYVRLLKKVFYSKAPEEIIHNVYIETGHKAISSNFIFKTGTTDIPLKYPEDAANAVFQQFSVFDGKSVLKHLDNRNEFEFRPAGLVFFFDFTEVIKHIESKLNSAIISKQSVNIFTDLFDGDSEIKIAIQNLSANTEIEQIKKYIPFSEKDKTLREETIKKYDELFLATRNKDAEIKHLTNIKNLLLVNIQYVTALNQYFTNEYLLEIQTAISDCNMKLSQAKANGIENFKTESITGIGTDEWKGFIIAAEKFAKVQDLQQNTYPTNEDNCLLCQQPLSKEAQLLINNYWAFIKSVAEQNAKNAIEQLEKVKAGFENLNFDLIPQETTLNIWLSEKFPGFLQVIQQNLLNQKELAQQIISDIVNKKISNRVSITIDTTEHYKIINSITEQLKLLMQDEQTTELNRLEKLKIFLFHKEKLETHFLKITEYITNQKWIFKASSINWQSLKTNITNTEKGLSNKYFNKEYTKIFNDECDKLKGNFGISIDPKSSGAKSNRQLLIKGNFPSAILSEGEQKVIAIADFLSEMHMSEVNKGIIFDDPVNSLDNDRKKQIAERLIEEALKKQVVIFTHDLVFFYHLKNSSKKLLAGITNCFIHHSVEKSSPTLSGRIILNSSPANEAQYHEPTKAEDWLNKSKAATGTERIDFSKAGLSSLRASYEALAIFTILGSTVQRFDPQIRMGRLKDVKFDKALINLVIEKHGEISDLIEAHLSSDEYGLIATPEFLEQHISDFKDLKSKLKLC